MRKRGGQLGNQNARKHGFYSKFLAETEKLDIEEAKGIQGLDDEMALLRVKLGHLLEDYPDRIDLHLRAIGMIARLTRIRDGLTMTEKESFDAAINNVLEEVAIPLGIKVIPGPYDEKPEQNGVPGEARDQAGIYCHSREGGNPVTSPEARPSHSNQKQDFSSRWSWDAPLLEKPHRDSGIEGFD